MVNYDALKTLDDVHSYWGAFASASKMLMDTINSH